MAMGAIPPPKIIKGSQSGNKIPEEEEEEEGREKTLTQVLPV